MNFSLQFDTLDGLDLDRVQRLVITLITEHAIRHTVQDLMVLQVWHWRFEAGGGGMRGMGGWEHGWKMEEGKSVRWLDDLE